MTRPLVIWNQHKLETLEEAIALAEAGGRSLVTWTETEKPSRYAKGIEHNWTMTMARETADHVRTELHLNPMPVFPENREGREP